MPATKNTAKIKRADPKRVFGDTVMALSGRLCSAVNGLGPANNVRAAAINRAIYDELIMVISLLCAPCRLLIGDRLWSSFQPRWLWMMSSRDSCCHRYASPVLCRPNPRQHQALLY